MLRNTFGAIVEMARNEARLSSNSSRGIDHLDHIKQLVKRHYTTLVEDYDWEHLQINRDYDHSRKQLQAGQRFYDFPTGLNVQKIDKMWLKWGNVWRVVDYGIEFANYSGLDPDNGSRADPVLRWDFYSESQFEIWPVPASDGDAAAPYSNWVGFEGQKAVEQYVSDTNRADLDDIMISLYVAAELMAENGQKAASDMKLAAAERRRTRLRGNMADRTRVTLGRGVVREHSRTYPRHPYQLYKHG
jgi:hypothetical protein